MSEAKTVVITGASAGIGRATSIAFAQRGWNVALLARDAEGLAATKADVERAGGSAMTVGLDVADAERVFAAVDQVVQRWGTIDVWVNNAMVTVFAPVAELTPSEIRRVTEVTYLGFVYGTMAALKHMRQRDAGTIIQVGSALSYRAIPLQSAYCAAKFAARGFTDALRCELLHDGSGVKIAMVQLPAVNTPQFDWARNKMPCRLQPVPPVHQPEPIAEAIFRAACIAPRELWVGSATVKAILGMMLAPGLLDRWLAQRAYDGQLSSEPSNPEVGNNLFMPVSTGHVAHGRFDRIAKDRIRGLNPVCVRMALLIFGLVLTAFGAAGWVFWILA